MVQYECRVLSSAAVSITCQAARSEKKSTTGWTIEPGMRILRHGVSWLAWDTKYLKYAIGSLYKTYCAVAVGEKIDESAENIA
jgi:hypothetical protein